MTPQSEPIPGSGQVANSEGGYAWRLDPWQQLDRFLILGTEGGTCYVDERKLTIQNATSVLACIAEDGERVVRRVVEISDAGRAAKNDPAIFVPAIFVLALCTTAENESARQAAFAALPRVCRTGTHLFQFASEVDALRGWGRGLRSAIGRWYGGDDVNHLTYQAIKYRRRGGWSHRDLLRLAHPKPASDAHRVLYKWIVDDELVGENVRIAAVEALKRAEDVESVAALIREHDLPREAIPTEWLTRPEVWEALFERMPVTAMLRNLGNLSKVGLLTPGSEATRRAIEALTNGERIRKARLHPIAVLIAGTQYGQGHGLLGSGKWKPVPRLVAALDAAFTIAFHNVEPTGKRFLLGVDVSGSMTCGLVAGTTLTPHVAATAMAMVTMRTEEAVTPMAFSHRFRKLRLTPNMSLEEAMKHTQDAAFGGTDCALPMSWALKEKLPIDTFVVYTDNQTWFGDIHPAQALAAYRDKMGIDAKLAVVGMTADEFTIADPSDQGMMDFVGFDAALPQALAEFARM